MKTDRQKQTEKNILMKTAKLASKGMFEKGLITINSYIEKHPHYSEDILINKAFFLYHYAASLLYSKSKPSHKIEIEIQQYFERAILICKKIIKEERINTVNYLNSRLYLAQIYVMQNKYKEANDFAKQTYKLKPSSLTSERIADIYLRSNDFPKAITWYKKSINLSNKIPQKLLSQIAIAICYRKMRKEKQATKEALLALSFIKKSKSKNDKNFIIILSKSLFDNFPEIIK
jgi:tetratricopeptide (TPR) repeat protein